MDDHVDAAGEALGDLLRRLGGGDVERERLAAQLADHPAQLLLGLRHVEADDARAVACERRGDRRADPPRGARDERDPAGERALPVELRNRRDAGADLDDLAGDVGRARREQEAQRRGELVLGADGDVHELHRHAAGAHLLAERAGEALERALRGRGPARARLRRGGGAEHDHPAAALQAAEPGWKKRCSSTSSVESAIPDASNTRPLKRSGPALSGL